MNETKADTGTQLRWDTQRRRRGSDCLSNLTLDQLVLGELAAGEAQRAQAHLDGCVACARARAALVADRDGYLRTADLPALARDALARAAAVPPRRWWARFAPRVALPALAAAAAATVLLARTPAQDAGTRAKGDFSLGLYVRHAESPAAGALHLGEPLHPGDQLRFKLGGAGRGYLVVLGIDAAGRVSVFFPAGDRAQALASPTEPLPGAIELDGTLGREELIAFRCDDARATAELVAHARRAAGGAAAERLGPGCVETRYAITKVPAQPER